MSKQASGPSRRQILITTSLVAGAASVPASFAQGAVDNVSQDLDRYVGFGIKASGGAGDNACGAWLESELKTCGFKTRRQIISVPYFDAHRAEFKVGSVTAPVIPHAIVVPTADSGVTGRLVRVDAALPPDQSLADAIALIDVPFKRWTSTSEPPIRSALAAAMAKGARAAILITNGPTRHAIALNTDGNKPIVDVPVAILAPEHATPFLAAAMHGETASLFLTGNGGRRDAFNLAGLLDRGKAKWMVVSTPRSGWFTCAGERGPGVAVWLALARWAPTALENYNLAFLCNTAHEYEYLGAEQSLEKLAPKPENTAMWLAIGAGLAARDWHDLFPTLLPLPSADPQRYLVVSESLLAEARQAFAGQCGFEAPYKTSDFTAGELTTVHNAGYETVAGIFGAHRFHHTQHDDERCLVIEPTRQAVGGFQALLKSIT